MVVSPCSAETPKLCHANVQLTKVALKFHGSSKELSRRKIRIQNGQLQGEPRRLKIKKALSTHFDLYNSTKAKKTTSNKAGN